MSDIWLPWCSKHDLTGTVNYGPFKSIIGVVLHVNADEAGTPLSYWGTPPRYVCPNFQVYKDGSTDQLLPLDWQPWCQVDGNQTFAAVETAGLPSEPLTGPQLDACAAIMAAYHDHLGVPLQVTDTVYDRGLGTHKMGGAAWGGHDCPGTIRANQRQDILNRAKGSTVISDDDANKIVDVMINRLCLGVDQRPHQIVNLARQAVQAECGSGGAILQIVVEQAAKIIHGDPVAYPNSQLATGPVIRKIADDITKLLPPAPALTGQAG